MMYNRHESRVHDENELMHISTNSFLSQLSIDLTSWPRDAIHFSACQCSQSFLDSTPSKSLMLESVSLSCSHAWFETHTVELA